MPMILLRRLCLLLFFAAAVPAGAATTAAERMLVLVNEIRSEHGLRPVRLDPRLTRAAEAHSRDMAEHEFVGHEGSGGGTLEDRVDRVGYPWRVIAENVAAGQRTPEEVVARWMDSPGHRDNLLRPELREIGVGHVEMPRGRGRSQYGDFWTLVLAAPLN